MVEIQDVVAEVVVVVVVVGEVNVVAVAVHVNARVHEMILDQGKIT
ncbi:MAG: hypothetical protein HYZ28_18425 [Myxococcales bacterium]|nr:hypothetical protein [Myxococcales bacterium]